MKVEFYYINKKIKLYKPEFSIHNLQYQLFYIFYLLITKTSKSFLITFQILNIFKIIKDINNNSTIKDKINVK